MCCICRLPNCCSNIICPRINFTIVVGSTVKSVGATTYYCNTTYVGGGCNGEVNWATRALCCIYHGIICENSINWSSVAN
jgi:hypothetical protein